MKRKEKMTKGFSLNEANNYFKDNDDYLVKTNNLFLAYIKACPQESCLKICRL